MYNMKYQCLYNAINSSVTLEETIFVSDLCTIFFFFPNYVTLQTPQSKNYYTLALQYFYISPTPPSLSLTFLQVFFQASAPCVQLLLRQGKGPFPRQLGKCEVGKLPLQVLV